MVERLAILISGAGTTMSEIIKAHQSGRLNLLEIGCIVSDNPESPGLSLAKDLGISTKDIFIIPRKPKETFGSRLVNVFQDRGITIIGQHGWLPLTPENVIHQYPGRIFNQHPGNPHLFGGKGMYGQAVYQAALYFYQQTGKENLSWSIVQDVAPEFDKGKILSAMPTEIYSNDTVISLQQRGILTEHQNVLFFYEKFCNHTLTSIELTDRTNLDQINLKILDDCRQQAIKSIKKT